MTSRKLLILGLDGADREAIVTGINRGKLPNFRDVAQAGDISTLKAPLPPLTPVSISSILTGKNPGEHGVFGFEEMDGSKTYVDYNSIQTRTLFDYLDDAGKTAIPVNVPLTNPLPDSVNIGISGFPISGSVFAKPYPVREKLRENSYSVEPSRFNNDTEDFVEEVFELAEKRFDISRELICEDWDLFFLMFTGDARLQHFVNDSEIITDFYSDVDRYLGQLLDEVEEDVEVLIISDHGFSELEARLDIGEWLSREGYLEENITSDTDRLYGKIEDLKEEERAYPIGAYLGGVNADEGLREEILEKLNDLEYNDKKVFRDVFLSEEIYGEK